MPLVKIEVTKQRIRLESDGNVYECLPTITLDSQEQNILAFGSDTAVIGGHLYWPLKMNVSSEKESQMFTKIMQYCLKNLLSMRTGWRHYICSTPKLEVNLSADLLSLKSWYQNNHESIGARSVSFVDGSESSQVNNPQTLAN
ncbi:hypothetical protein ACPV5L_01295 [Vibrio astriarenae]|jgi:hypothetical protein